MVGVGVFNRHIHSETVIAVESRHTGAAIIDVNDVDTFAPGAFGFDAIG